MYGSINFFYIIGTFGLIDYKREKKRRNYHFSYAFRLKKKKKTKAFFPHFFVSFVEKLFAKGFSSEAHLIEIHFISQLVFFQSKHSNFFLKYSFLLFSYKILSIQTKQVQFKLDLCELMFVLLLLHFVGF